jgi:2'-5' RNA ligase
VHWSKAVDGGSRKGSITSKGTGPTSSSTPPFEVTLKYASVFKISDVFRVIYLHPSELSGLSQFSYWTAWDPF